MENDKDNAKANSRDAEWSPVTNRIIDRLPSAQCVNRIYFLTLSENKKQLQVFVFLNNDKDLAELDCLAQMANCIKEELDNVQKGEKDGWKCTLEFDSHENVVNNYRGNYFLRLR